MSYFAIFKMFARFSNFSWSLGCFQSMCFLYFGDKQKLDKDLFESLLLVVLSNVLKFLTLWYRAYLMKHVLWSHSIHFDINIIFLIWNYKAEHLCLLKMCFMLCVQTTLEILCYKVNRFHKKNIHRRLSLGCGLKFINCLLESSRWCCDVIS